LPGPSPVPLGREHAQGDHVRIALLEALELLSHPGLLEPRRHIVRSGGRDDAVAELRELAADVRQVGVDLLGEGAGLAGQVVLLGAEQDLVALADQQQAADDQGDDARQQQRYDEDRPQLEAA